MRQTEITPGEDYFARVTAGMEHIAWLDVHRLPSTLLVEQKRRLLQFTYDGSPEHLLEVRSVDDIYVLVGRFSGVNSYRSSLERIAQQISDLPLTETAEVCAHVRTLPEHPTYTVTASVLGCNYSRHEVAQAIRDGLQTHSTWTYVENTPAADLDLRVVIEGDDNIIGLRLGETPLHRRSYKQKNLPGSLKPPIAYCMCLLAGTSPDDIILDPMCGVGTIPIEAAMGFNAAKVYGRDIDSDAIRYATENGRSTESDIHFNVGDATDLHCEDASVDCIVSNLPWGKQVDTPFPLRETYAAAVPEFHRVLSRRGRAVLLTERVGLLLKYVERLLDLHVAYARQISLYGLYPTILVLVKRTNPPNVLQPFEGIDTTEVGLNELASETILDNLSHPSFRLRLRAVNACAHLDEPDVQERLQDVLADNDGRVRSAATQVLKRLST